MQRLKVPRYIQWIVLTGLIFLLIMTLLRLTLVQAFPHPSLKTLHGSFWLGFKYDLRIISIVSMIVFLIGSIKPLHPFKKKQGRLISFWLWSVFIFSLCLAYAVDFPHYAYLGQRLNGSVLNYLDDAKISIKMVWETYPLLKILIALILGIVLMMWIVTSLYNYILSKPIVSEKKNRIIWGIVFFLILAVGIFGRIGQYPLRWSDAFILGNDYQAQIALNPFQSFFSSLNYRHSTYDLNKVKQAYPWMSQHLNVDHPDESTLNFERSYPGDFSVRPNVVLVICESFSAYKSSMAGNPLNTTPFFQEMVNNGIYFDRCFSPSYGTARGVWAIITGVPDVQPYKTASRNPAAVNQRTIINDFKGYDKFYFLGGSTSWANIRGLLTNNIEGLKLYEEGDYELEKVDVWGISDKSLFIEANKVLSTKNKPFFAVIQTADNHRPYTIPEEDSKGFIKKNLPLDSLNRNGFATNEEYNAFRYTDFCYQHFIDVAKKEKYFSNTLFVFVGDHGIKGDASNILPKVFTDQSLTSEHIPLLFYAPSLLKKARYNYPASQVDVLPTIAGLCNISYTNSALGKDLLKDTSANGYAAFISDPDTRRIGIVRDNLYYSYGLNGGNESIQSIANNNKVNVSETTKMKYRNITDAYYNTALYLLLNNKKKNP